MSRIVDPTLEQGTARPGERQGRFTTVSGMPIEPLYVPADAAGLD